MKAVGTIALTAILGVFLVGNVLAAQAPVGLGTASSFAVLAGSTITNTGPTTITGNVGLAPGTAVTGFSSVTLSGTQHIADAVALQAQSDLVTAYTDAAGRTPVTVVATELGGQTLKAGVYTSATGTFGVTGTLTLDAEGNSGAVFIFQTASTLITASASKVSLVNGASACNVYWQIGSSATLGTSSSFTGNILALTSISLTTGAKLDGRALARNGAVTLDTNVITGTSCSSAPVSSPSPSASASASPSPSPSPSASATPSASPSATPSPTPIEIVVPSGAGAGVSATPPSTTTGLPGQDTGGSTVLPFLVVLLAVMSAIGLIVAPRRQLARRRR